LGQQGRGCYQFGTLAGRAEHEGGGHVEHDNKTMAALVNAHDLGAVRIGRNGALVHADANAFKQQLTTKRHALFQVHHDGHGLRPMRQVRVVAKRVASGVFMPA
jgi:hypothetical protein